jgi:hypothetical protein
MIKFKATELDDCGATPHTETRAGIPPSLKISSRANEKTVRTISGARTGL